MRKAVLVRCNKAGTKKCPDRWRHKGCGARTLHPPTASCVVFTCLCDGGFQCKCVKPTPKKKEE